MKKLLFVLSVFMPIIGFAQSMAPNDIPSPNASELGRFGDIPVSYYTGKPDISVPLYELECKGVKMPIKLQYDATGVLMNSLPGWTGHNWTLMAGGAITRVQQGRPDEYRLPEQHPRYNQVDSYFHTSNRLLELEDRDSSLNAYIPNRYDYEPDIFYFNMLGMSGRFFFGNDGNWKVACDANIHVVFDVYDESNYIEPFIQDYPFYETTYQQSKSIRGFTLVDEKGIRYHFGGHNDAIEYTTDFHKSTDIENTVPWVANTWYLTGIDDKNGNHLYRLDYERGKFVTWLYNNSQTIYYQGTATLYGGFLKNLLNGTFGNSYYISSDEDACDGKIISPVYLLSIETESVGSENGVIVEFKSEDIINSKTMWHRNYNVGMESYYPEKQDSISCELIDISYKLDAGFLSDLPTEVKQYYINKGYYYQNQYYYLQTDDNEIAAYQNGASYRETGEKNSFPLRSCCLRKLNSIVQYSRNSDHGICYSFDYDFNSRMHLTNIWIGDSEEDNDINSTYHQGGYTFIYQGYSQLPSDYLTESVDAWGFYGTSASSVNTAYTKCGTLTDIVYPTGGVTSFEYEQNQYGKYMSVNRQNAITENGYAGGLRIRQISEYEDISKSKLLGRRTFCYTLPNSATSSGELFAKPKQSWTDWRPFVVSNSSSYPTDIGITYSRQGSLIPLSNSFGPHIGYSYVTETFLNGSKNVYHYYNISETKDAPYIMISPLASISPIPGPFDKYSERGYKRGCIKSIEYYESDGTLAKKIVHGYRTDNVEQNYVLGCNFSLANYDQNNGSSAFVFCFGGLYKLFYPKYDVVSDTITYPGKTEIVSYQRQDYHPVIGNAQTDIRLLLSKTLCRNGNTFKTTYQYPVTMASGTIEHDHLLPQFFHQPVQSKEYLNGHEVSSHTTKYMQQHGLILPQYELESKYGSTPDTLITYLNYSNKGTLLQYRERGMPVTTLQWEGNDNYLKSKTVGTHVTSYTYDDAWNLSSITQPNGDKQYFNYDGLGRLIEILDRNQKVLKRFQYHYKTEQQ